MPTEPVKREPILDRPTLKVGSKVFDRWKRVSIDAGIGQAAASFKLSVGPLRIGETDLIDELAPGTLVEVDIGDRQVLRGIVDTQRIASSGTDESLEINGRDVMGLLVDSFIWRDLDVAEPGDREATRKVTEIAREVIGRFETSGGQPCFSPEVRLVVAEGSDEEVGSKVRRPQEDQTCEQYLRGLAQDRGLDLWMESDGTLVMGSRAQQRSDAKAEQPTDVPVLCLYTYRDADRVHQNNFKDTSITRTITGAFSDYTAYGRVYVRGKNRAISRSATDPGVKVFKPKYFQVDNAEKAADLERRASAERDEVLERRYELSGTAVGFGQIIDGERVFYEVNRVVKVVHEAAHVDEEFFISKVGYSVDVSGGPQTSLTLQLGDPTGK